ncbi:MAG TPA: hypothetical protein VKA34_04310 [Balneolales bacterium]|nr:hypothetical protein [Balneolales bacterium]
MELDPLHKDYIRIVKPGENVSPDTNRELFSPDSVNDDSNMPEGKGKSGNQEEETQSQEDTAKGKDERSSFLNLTKNPEFPRMLALFYHENEEAISDIKRSAIDERGLDELLPFPKYTLSFVYYQNRRLRAYLKSLYHFADIPGKRFQGFI